MKHLSFKLPHAILISVTSGIIFTNIKYEMNCTLQQLFSAASCHLDAAKGPCTYSTFEQTHGEGFPPFALTWDPEISLSFHSILLHVEKWHEFWEKWPVPIWARPLGSSESFHCLHLVLVQSRQVKLGSGDAEHGHIFRVALGGPWSGQEPNSTASCSWAPPVNLLPLLVHRSGK